MEGWVHRPAEEAEKSVLSVVVRAQSLDLRVAHQLLLLEILTWNKGYQEAEFFLFTVIETVTSGCGDATGARAGFQDTAAEAVAPSLQPALAPGGTFWPASSLCLDSAQLGLVVTFLLILSIPSTNSFSP